MQAEARSPNDENAGKDRKEVSQERLSQLAKARPRALEVRKERSGLKKKEKELKDKFYTNKKIELDSFERHLNKRSVRTQEASDDQEVEKPTRTITKKRPAPVHQHARNPRHEPEEPSGDFDEDNDRPEGGSPPPPPTPVVRTEPLPTRHAAPPAPRQQQQHQAPQQPQPRTRQPEYDTVAREADAYTLDAYKRKMAEAKILS